MLSKILRDSYYAQYAVSLDESGRLNLTYNNEVFSIYNNNDQTLTVNFCSAIAYAIYSAGVKIKLDLSNLKEITAASSVLLFAEVNRWQLVYGGDIIVIVLPEDKIARKTFLRSQLWEAIKPGAEAKSSRLTEYGFPFSTNNDYGVHILKTLEGLELDKIPNESIEHFRRGCSEAILNVKNHAYQTDTDIGRRWWQLCYHNTEQRKIYLIVHDRGMGIPKTLKNNPKLSNNLPLLSQPSASINHGELINLSMKRGISRHYDDPVRGQGSEDIKRPVQLVSEGTAKLEVWSSKGQWRFLNGSVPQYCDRTVAIPGTIVEWIYEY